MPTGEVAIEQVTAPVAVALLESVTVVPEIVSVVLGGVFADPIAIPFEMPEALATVAVALPLVVVIVVVTGDVPLYWPRTWEVVSCVKAQL